jgi:3,4-dihydroxy-9,10-secoandrosta-1,3,5(10)-triene-9,17-dione 4,5-dioxygenase
MKVLSLGYLGIGAPDPQQWLTYGTEILGLMPARALPGEDWGVPMVGSGPASGGSGVGEDGSVYLKMDEQQWRIAVHPSQDNAGLMYMGLELAGAQELREAVLELQGQDIKAEMGSAEQARQRSVSGIAYTQDPAGNKIELYYGPTKDFNFESPRQMQFLTGDKGLGHMNLFVADLDACRSFYSDLLGFKLSDYMEFAPGMSVEFYHCNGRHHTLGLSKVGDLNALHHLMLETTDIDMVGRCLDRVQKAGIKVTSTLGRHVNDNILSFYMSSPFGFEVEIGYDGVVVDENWRPRQFVEGDVWGHQGLDPIAIKETADNIKV